MAPRDDPRPARVRALLGAARRELRAPPGFSLEREQALVERILARTTRARPWRARHRRGWRSAAAAALLFAAGAGWLALGGRAAREIPPAVAALSAAAPTPAPAAELRTAAGSLDVLTGARAELAAAASASPRGEFATGAGADAPLELRLLEARARGLRERRWDPWLREVALGDAGTLSLALWCDVQLDRYVLSGDRPPAWKQAVGILRRDLERPGTPRESSKLLAHALGRARDYGLADGVELASLGPSARIWSSEWFDHLDAAGHEAGIAETGVWRAWVDWRGR